MLAISVLAKALLRDVITRVRLNAVAAVLASGSLADLHGTIFANALVTPT
jgi:hypothetical protein